MGSDCFDAKADYWTEAAYRRGCHQTIAMILSASRDISQDELRDFLTEIEVILRKVRRDKKAGKDGLYVFRPHPDLLHEAISKAKKRIK